jgi:oligoendopeptidase F
MQSNLPESPSTLVSASWEDLAPRYRELSGRPLADLAGWVRDWSELEKLMGEAARLAAIAYSADTRDAERERVHLRWVGEIQPHRREEADRLARRLLETGLVLDGMETVVRRFGNQVDLFRAANLPIQAETSRVSAAYEKLTGAMTVDWDGEQLTIPQVMARTGVPDRRVRERAFRLSFEPYIHQRAELVQLFDAMYGLRQQMAANAGFGSFRDYAHREKNRFEYSVQDGEPWNGGGSGWEWRP